MTMLNVGMTVNDDDDDNDDDNISDHGHHKINAHDK